MAKAENNWFEVDRKGLRLLIDKRSKAFIIYELVQNSWDANTTEITVTIEPEPNTAKAMVIVSDDSPEGFSDLRHAYTLYAESLKKTDATKRGRFNLGEKLVLALCDEAKISTTTGTVFFDHRGRTHSKAVTKQGSIFEGLMRMTRDEMNDIIDGARRLLPPEGKKTTINGEEIPYRKPLLSFEARLPTVHADEDGVMRPTIRVTTVHVHLPKENEVASIYEMGIPVVETGDRFHLDVDQKVPLNTDRDNVPPGYLRLLRALALNHTAALMSADDKAASWVTEATTDKAVEVQAVASVLDARYGEKRVSYDPSDPEANLRAAAEGYSVIHGRALPAATWQKVKEGGLARPAGQVTPGHFQAFSPDGEEVKTVPEEKWTDGMRKIVTFYKKLARELIDCDMNISMVSDLRIKYPALFGGRSLTLNKARLGNAFFESGITQSVVNLGLHELSHSFPGADNHLADAFHEACTKLGAKLAFAVAAGRISLS